MKSIKCPKCKVVMEKVVSPDKRYVIDVCPKCEGVFLDKGELNVLGKQSFLSYILNWFRR